MSSTEATTSRPAEAQHGLVRGICEMTLEACDISELERFYRHAFGCSVIKREDSRVWLSCGSHTRLGIWSPGKKEFGDRGGRHVHFAMSVGRGDLDALRRHLETEGFEHRGAVEHEGGDRSLYIEDPDGNVVEVWDFFEHGEGSREGVDAL